MGETRVAKTRILFYTGHDELIGGDVHYAFDIVNQLDRSRFDVEMFTDVNPLFEARAKAWLKVPVSISFLNTRPVLFRKFFPDNVYENLEKRKRELRGPRKLFYRVLGARFGKRRVSDLIRVFLKILTFYHLREFAHNACVFWRLFRSKKGVVDVLHVNNGGYPGKDAALMAVMMGRICRIPKIVMTFHNVPVPRNRFKPWDRVYDHCVPRSCEVVISASDMIRADILAVRGFPAEKVRTVRCGLPDVPAPDATAVAQKRSELGLTPGTVALMICGNFEEPRKGHEFLLQSLAAMKADFSAFTLFIVGSGSESRESRLRSLVADLGLESNVRFLGYRTDIAELNASIDVALTPSVGNEAIPYTITEAMRVGKPVVTTTVGGCTEAVRDGVTGFVVKPFDVGMLKDKLLRLCREPALRRDMGEAGRRDFLAKFLLSERVREHEAIYSG